MLNKVWGKEGIRKQTHKLEVKKEKEAFWPNALKEKGLGKENSLPGGV